MQAENSNRVPARWVCNITTTSGIKLDVSDKGAVAINGNKSRPVYWETLLLIGNEEIKQVLATPGVAQYLVSPKSKRLAFEAAALTRYMGMGLPESHAKILAAKDVAEARKAGGF